jgi:hypothetical protein
VIKYILAIVFFLLLVSPAQAKVTVIGGDAVHRQVIWNVINEYPVLRDYIDQRFDVTVKVGYYGISFKGLMWVDGRRNGKAFSDLVAHEYSHQLWMAVGKMTDWRVLNENAGYEVIYPTRNWYRNFAENFAENVKRAYWSPYYTLTTTPNSELIWLSRAEMKKWLYERGVK